MSQQPTVPLEYKLDQHLNKIALDFVSYTALGYIGGVAVSLFFKRKAFIRNLGAGFGAGYQLSENIQNLPKRQ